jgi:hypothetical protein
MYFTKTIVWCDSQPLIPCLVRPAMIVLYPLVAMYTACLPWLVVYLHLTNDDYTFKFVPSCVHTIYTAPYCDLLDYL